MLFIGQIDFDSLTHIGDAGIAVALMIMIIWVVGAAAWVGNHWLKTRREEARLEHDRKMKQIEQEAATEKARLEAENRREGERLEVERAQTNILRELKGELQRSIDQREADRTIWESLTTSVQQLTAVSTSLNSRMIEADERMTQIAERREKRLDDIELGIQSVAGTVKAELQPQIDAVRATIEQGFQQLSTYVEAQMDQLGEDLPGHTRRMLKAEIDAYTRQTERKLDAIANIASHLQKWLEEHAELVAIVEQGEDDL